MAIWTFEITCPKPGPYGDHNVEAEIHGYTLAQTEAQEHLTWEGQIEFTCEIGPRYTQGRGTASPVELKPLEIVSLPEPGSAMLCIGAIAVVVLHRFRRHRIVNVLCE